MPALHHHQSSLNTVAQHGFYGLGHGRASLTGADHENATVPAEVIASPRYTEKIAIAQEDGARGLKGVYRIQRGLQYRHDWLTTRWVRREDR